MTKRVLSVGQCSADHAAIRSLVEGQFDARLSASPLAEQALEALRDERFDLVLVNRKLDADYSDGLEIIKQIKADPAIADTPVMLVSNFGEHQATAIAAGAEPGFGKAELHKPQTREKIAQFLTPR